MTIQDVRRPAPRGSRDAVISLRDLYGSVCGIDVLHGIDLDVADGEFVTLLGPADSGMSTLLRLIAGYDTATAGSIRLGAAEVTAFPPFMRDVNAVFGGFALFPELTVAQNVEYPLQIRKIPRLERSRRVQRVLQAVGLSRLEHRRPDELTGGEQHLIALARALVLRPRVLLLDDPFGRLPEASRTQMRAELRRVQRELGTTMLMATTDHEDALALSDRVVVLEEGRIAQIGTPAEIIEYPQAAYVAAYLGTPARQPVLLDIRPDKIRIGSPGEPLATGEVAMLGTVRDVIHTGPTTRLVIQLDGGTAMVAVEHKLRMSVMDALGYRQRRVQVSWPDDDVTPML
ncbi:ABC transporter ATP-binding protein [Pseudonocardiaceae bacterium YIM PH 21723]|nr:ABC transporter ATP-binding protein [Pseudonocardiaceae bacterium YIM PH 21723]